MGRGGFRGKDESRFNAFFELTEDHSGEQTGLQLENWPKVQKGSQYRTWRFGHLPRGSDGAALGMKEVTQEKSVNWEEQRTPD